MSLNILNPKSLERQLKIVETEIAKLQGQMDELIKVRSACLVLLGTVTPEVTEMPAEENESDKTAESKKQFVSPKELPPRIIDLLRQKEAGMTADEIFDALKSGGLGLRGKSPVALVYSTLEKNPDLFVQKDDGNWTATGAMPSLQ